MPTKGTTVVNQCRERNLIKEYLIQAVCRMSILCELYDPAHCTISLKLSGRASKPKI